MLSIFEFSNFVVILARKNRLLFNQKCANMQIRKRIHAFKIGMQVKEDEDD